MQMRKFQITLTPQEVAVLSFQAGKLGYDVTKYIKFLVSQEAFSVATNIPTFSLSEKLEKKSAKAQQDYQKRKVKEFDSIDQYLGSV